MIQTQVRPGAYYDSVVLMQLQRSLATLPGVFDAGVVMGTPANKEVLAQSELARRRRTRRQSRRPGDRRARQPTLPTPRPRWPRWMPSSPGAQRKAT